MYMTARSNIRKTPLRKFHIPKFYGVKILCKRTVSSEFQVNFPKTLQKLCASTTFSHQEFSYEVKLRYLIQCSTPKTHM